MKMNTPASSYGEIRSYVQLQHQIHDDLRIQHPEWVQPDGESPMCDSYEARLLELLLGISTLRGSNESIAAPHHALDFLGGKGGQFSPNQTQITESRVPASTIG
jgi:hypothetical protein